MKRKSTTPNENTVRIDHPKRANAVCARMWVSGAAKNLANMKEREERIATSPKIYRAFGWSLCTNYRKLRNCGRARKRDTSVDTREKNRRKKEGIEE